MAHWSKAHSGRRTSSSPRLLMPRHSRTSAPYRYGALVIDSIPPAMMTSPHRSDHEVSEVDRRSPERQTLSRVRGRSSGCRLDGGLAAVICLDRPEDRPIKHEVDVRIPPVRSSTPLMAAPPSLGAERREGSRQFANSRSSTATMSFVTWRLLRHRMQRDDFRPRFAPIWPAKTRRRRQHPRLAETPSSQVTRRRVRFSTPCAPAPRRGVASTEMPATTARSSSVATSRQCSTGWTVETRILAQPARRRSSAPGTRPDEVFIAVMASSINFNSCGSIFERCPPSIPRPTARNRSGTAPRARL